MPLLLCSVLAAVMLSGGVDRQELARGFELRTVPRTIEPVLRLLGRVARNQPETAILGTWNDLSPALVEGYLRRDPDFPQARRPLFPRLGRKAPEEICRVLEVRRVVVLEPLEPRTVPPPGRADFAAETAWLEPWRDALARAPCFEPTQEWTVKEAGYRLRVYARVASREPTSTRAWPRHPEPCIIASSCAAVAQADRAGVS